MTKSGLVLGGGGDTALYAFDKASGKELARFELPRRASATPMTYRAKSGRQFIVMATGTKVRCRPCAHITGITEQSPSVHEKLGDPT